MQPSRHTILFVEDDQFLRKILATKFAREGFFVSGAGDAEEGLRSLTEFVPDIILLDLVLPGMSGFDLLAAIRRNPATAHVPVMVLTNLGQPEDRQRASSLGAAEFLVKADLSLNEVVQRVRDAYARHAQAAEKA